MNQSTNPGVGLWLNFSKILAVVIISLSMGQLALVSMMYTFGTHKTGELWATLAILIFSTVAVLLLRLIHNLLHSEDLNMAMHNLDIFVQNCGRGLDWASVAKKQRYHFLLLWSVMMLLYLTQQVLETWTVLKEDAGGNLAVQLRFANVTLCFVLFGVCSSVVMNGTYLQFNLLLGLGKTLDCWCGDILESKNFIGGINSWNSLQALLKCVGREVTNCFTASKLLLGDFLYLFIHSFSHVWLYLKARSRIYVFLIF